MIRPGPLKNALSGSWLGHALHPMLTDVTIGSFTSAVALDWLGGDESEPAAQRLIGLGLLSALPTVSSGYSDWADTEVANDAVRRIGVVHAAGNFTAASLFAASWLARRRGDHGAARRSRWPAGGARRRRLPRRAPDAGRGRRRRPHDVRGRPGGLDAGARRRRAARRPDALRRGRRHGGDGRPQRRRPVRAVRPLLAPRRPAARGHARRPPRSRCPWHDSVFDLRDGALVHGPAAYPQPAWDTRVRDGRIEVRRR